jgi:nitroimidazol reductase NimA-like FMN-containing flavoprotein (pyridoxamine 5'-phosphate oxidase superfamily)
MRRAEKEIRSREEILAIVKRARIMRLGLVDGEEPYVVPLSYGFDGESLYFHCAREGRKLELIRSSGRVCFEMDELLSVVEAPEACGWGARYRSVIGTGRAVILSDREAKRHGLEAIMAQYSERCFAFPESQVDRTCVVRIDITSLSGKQALP